MKLLFMINSSMERSSHVTPLLNPLPTRTLPLKTSVYFPIINTICKQWAKFITCSPSPENGGNLIVLKDLFIRFFDYAEQKLSKNFNLVTLGKTEHRRLLSCASIFPSTKMGSRNLIFVRMSPLATF